MKDKHQAIITAIEPGISATNQGPLHGLDFVVKDMFDVAGLPTYAGNPEYAKYRGTPTKNAAAVDALLNAGARLIGKTHMHELAYGITGINPHYDTPINPLDSNRIPGGSSSGSAVAVAAGLTPFALGTDTAGSVRVPAAFCGVCSLRPTYGRIPVDGLVPLSPSLDTVGIFAANFELLGKVAGVLLDEKTNVPAYPVNRIVTVAEIPSLDENVDHFVTSVIKSLQNRSANISDKIKFTLLADALDAQRVVQYAEVFAVHEQWLKQYHPRLGKDVALHLETASKLSVQEIGRAISSMAMYSAQFSQIVGSDGIFVLPASAGPAPLLAELSDFENAMKFRLHTLAFNTPASITGLPAVTIPFRTEDGLSVGVQLIGPPNADMTLIKLAAGLAKELPPYPLT